MEVKYTVYLKSFDDNHHKTLNPIGHIIANDRGDVKSVSPDLLNYEGEKVSLRDLLRRWSSGAYYETHTAFV